MKESLNKNLCIFTNWKLSVICISDSTSFVENTAPIILIMHVISLLKESCVKMSVHVVIWYISILYIMLSYMYSRGSVTI